jgi:16S rRNA processing protein RimM
MTDAFVPVGVVGRPHGLDGAFVVELGSDDDRRYAVGAKLYLDGVAATVVLSRRVGRGKRAIRLDRAAERGQQLTVRRSDLPALEAGEFYAFELVGLTVAEKGGGRLGTVQELLPGSANDNLVLDDGTLVPMIEDAIAEIDLSGGRILLNPGFIG